MKNGAKLFYITNYKNQLQTKMGVAKPLDANGEAARSYKTIYTIFIILANGLFWSEANHDIGSLLC